MSGRSLMFRVACAALLFAIALPASAQTQTELIVNGGFEQVGSGWVVSTDGANTVDSWWNLNNAAGAYAGSRYVYLGAKQDGISVANNVNGAVYQTVTIPAGTTTATLSYYLRITTQETGSTAYDRLFVEVRNTSGTVLATLTSHSNADASSFSAWTQRTLNLSSYAGQVVQVAFHGTTDASVMTVFRLDEVSLKVSGPTAVAPTVQTVAASSIATTSAQLNGSVNPHGASTSAYFEYGTTTSYGNTTSTTSAGSGNSSIAMTATASGLSPSTTYNYRAVATNSAGTSRGGNASFTTNALSAVLNVTPASRPVSAASGSTTFSVANSGGGTLSYTASVTSGAWLSVSSGASGSSGGTITVSYSANTGSARSGTIQVTATGATGSPANVTVSQDASSSSATFKLKFPLQGFTPYDAPVTSAFDHSVAAGAALDNKFTTFTDERGVVVVTDQPPHSFKKSAGDPGNKAFFVGVINYVGISTGPTVINYDDHRGYDYKVAYVPVYAAADGWVEKAYLDGVEGLCPEEVAGKGGKYVRLQHDAAAYQTQYLHLSRIDVSYGQQVYAGQTLLGVSGNTGCSEGAHLHFEVKKKVGDAWVSVDPYGWAGCSGCDPYTAAPNIDLWEARPAAVDPEILSLTTGSHEASWVYYVSSVGQWFISHASGVTYLLSGANGYSGELTWGRIADLAPVASIDFIARTVSISSNATTLTGRTSYRGLTIAGGRQITVNSARAYEAAQQVAGKPPLAHAWYFFQVQSTGVWYIVNVSGPIEVYRLRLKPDNTDYWWLVMSTPSWRREFSGSSAAMSIKLYER